MWLRRPLNGLIIALVAILCAGAKLPLVWSMLQANLGYSGLIKIPYEHINGATEEETFIGQIPARYADLARQSLSQFRSSLASAPNKSASYGLGRLLLRLHDFLGAYDAFENVIGDKGEIAFPWKMVALVHTDNLSRLDWVERTQLGEKLAQRARLFVKTGRRIEGLVMYELATTVGPEISESWLDKIELYANEWSKAGTAYQQASQLFPDDPYVAVAGAFIRLYGYQDPSAATILIEHAMETLKEIDIVGLSRTHTAWLYYGYIISADLALQRGDRKAARAWLDKAAQVPNVSLDQGINLRNLSELVKAGN
jgi:tetratricopeptide (TPR) repeat protein